MTEKEFWSSNPRKILYLFSKIEVQNGHLETVEQWEERQRLNTQRCLGALGLF